MPLSAFAGDTFVIPTRAKNPGVHAEIIRACAVSGFRPKVKDCTEGQSCLFFVAAGMGVSFATSRDDATYGNGMQIIELADPALGLKVRTHQGIADGLFFDDELVKRASN